MKIFLQFLLNTLNHGWQSAVKKYQSITSTSLDEIVFEDREKEYGAYMLRKNYPWHLALSLTVVVLGFLYVCFLPVFMGWLAKYHSPESTGIKYIPKEFSISKEKEGFITAVPSRNFLSRADLEGMRKFVTIYPKASPEETHNSHEENWQGRGKSDWNTTSQNSINVDPKLDPDTTLLPGNQYPRIKRVKPIKEEEYFCGLIPDDWEEREIPELICVCEYDSNRLFVDPAAFVFVEEEPAPINLKEVKECIGFPTVSSSSFYVFRILVDRKGNYQKHLVLNGEASQILTDIESCLPNLKFTPAIQGDRPIPFWVNIPFRIETE